MKPCQSASERARYFVRLHSVLHLDLLAVGARDPHEQGECAATNITEGFISAKVQIKFKYAPSLF